MTTRTVLGCFLVAATVGSTSISAQSPQSEISAVLNMQQEAWNRGDIDAFMNGYARGSRQSGSGSTVFVSEDKVTRAWQTDYQFDPRC